MEVVDQGQKTADLMDRRFCIVRKLAFPRCAILIFEEKSIQAAAVLKQDQKPSPKEGSEIYLSKAKPRF